MSLLPGIYFHELERRKPLVNDQALVRGQDVVLDRATHSPIDPKWRIHPGTVIARALANRRYLPATDPNGERNQPASVSALQPADATWAGTTITVSQAPGLGFPVRITQAVTDNAGVIDRLNRDRNLQVLFLADEDAQGHVRIRSRASGADQYLHVQSSLPAAFGPDGIDAQGVDADYRVTIDHPVEVQTIDGKPAEAVVPTLLAGHFDTPELFYLTPEARVVLSRRGSIFKK